MLIALISTITRSNSKARNVLSRALLAVLLCALAAFAPRALQAQVTTAEIVGTVTDQGGAMLPGAKVMLKNLDTGTAQTATANSAGDYTFNLLPIGRYTVTVAMPNFRSYKVDEVALAAGDRTRINASLPVGNVSEIVEVTSQLASVQTDSSTVGSLFDTKEVQDLPLNGRNVFNLVNLTPGVTAGTGPGGNQALSSGTRPDDRRQSSAYSANGQDPSANNNLIDGVDNNDRLIGTIGVRPSIDAIAEVKIQTNLYSADIGRTSGGVVNILTKSGTNKFHGTAFEFFRNDIFDANSYYNFTKATTAPPRTPKYRQNQFGGSIGGPIIKDKTFFFGDYEGLRIVQGGTITGIVVPTALQRVGNFSEACTSSGGSFSPAGACSDPSHQISLTTAVGAAPAGIVPFNRLDQGLYSGSLDPIGLKVAALYPQPNAGAAVTGPNYTATGTKVYFGHTFDIKIDHHFNDRNTLRGRYSFNQVAVNVPGLFPDTGTFNPGSGTSGIGGSFPGQNKTRAQNFLLNYVRVITPNVLVELNASYLRDFINSQNINYGKNVASQLGIPGVNLADPQTSGLSGFAVQGFQNLGDSVFTPLLEIDNSYEYRGAVTWVKGRHNIKVGGGFIRRQFSILQSTSARGNFTFNGSAGNAAAPVENGTYNPAAPITPSTGNNDGAGLANLLFGSPVTISRVLAPFLSSYRTWEPNVYVQDDWRATSWLTLNLGVRYDLFTPKSEVRDRISNVNIFTGQVLYPGFNTNRTTGIRTAFTSLAPRIGFAATVAKDLVVRGGYGISFYPGDVTTTALLKNPPFVPSQTCGPTSTTPCSTYGAFGSLSQGLFVPSVNFSTTTLASGLPTISIPAGSGFSAIDQNFRPSYMHQFNVLVEKGFGRNVVGVGYVGSIGRNLVMDPPDVNRALPSGTATANPRPISLLNPNIARVEAFYSAGISNYNALQVSVQRRLSRGFGANAGYTYAHEIDDVTGLAATGSSGYGNLIGSQSTVVSNVQAYDRSTGDFNIGHRGFLAANYELPKANVSHLVGGAINGWQVNGTIVWQSGLPYTVTGAVARAGIAGLNGGERPNRAAQTLNLPTQTSTPQGLAYVDPAAFTLAPSFTLGNAGRNIGTGPRQSFVNASFFKTFSLPREMNLQFRTEIFNVPNHRIFNQPVVNSFGNPTTFGKITTVSPADSPRQIQLALKLAF